MQQQPCAWSPPLVHMTPQPPASFTRFAVGVRCISTLFILVQTEQGVDTPSVWVGNHFHLWIKFWCQVLLPSLTFKNWEDLDNEFSEEKNPISAITIITKVATLPLLAVRFTVGVTQDLPAPIKSPDLSLSHAKHCWRHWGCNWNPNRPSLCPLGAYVLVGSKQVNHEFMRSLQRLRNSL